MKNYSEIVLFGFINPDTRNFLRDYFIREQKKAAIEGFSAQEFFSGCLSVLESFEKDIERQYSEERNNLLRAQTFINDEEQKKEIESELKSLAKDNYSAYLPGLTKGKFTGSLWLEEIREIKRAIIGALEEVKKSERKKDLMDLLEVCQFLKLSKYAIRKLCKEGKIPYRKYGRSYVFSRKALIKWQEKDQIKQKIATAAEKHLRRKKSNI